MDIEQNLDRVLVRHAELTALLSGDTALTEHMKRDAAALRHIALRRMTWYANSGAGGVDELFSPLPGDRLSIHWLGQEDFGDWLGLLNRILAAHGKPPAGL